MRHNKSGKVLGRTWEHRKAMFRNMAKSLVTYGRIQTTETKAKELRKVADRLVTLALRNDLHAKRQAYKVLGNHSLVKKLFDDYGPCFSGVQGGFTRVVKLGLPRKGDCAPMAVIEFTRQPGLAHVEPEKLAKTKTTEVISASPVVEEVTPAAEPEAAADAPEAETHTVASEEPTEESAAEDPAESKNKE